MKIIFERHGKDDERYRGGWSTLELLPAGVVQAQKVAEKLKPLGITEIIASDLPRTMQTAAIAGKALGLPVKSDPQLREINNGKLSGMLKTDALREYPGVFFTTLGFDEPYPGGESPHAFFDRVKAWFEDFVEKNRDHKGNILVVTHNGVISVVYHIVNGIPWSNQQPTHKTSYCRLRIYDVETNSFQRLTEVLKEQSKKPSV